MQLDELKEKVRKEGPYKAFKYKGFECRIIRPHQHEKMVHLCGYVGLPKDNKFFGEEYENIPVEVHGGLTYASHGLFMQPEEDLWWIGFDCAHSGDITMTDFDWSVANETYRDMDYVESEIKTLVDQLIREQE